MTYQITLQAASKAELAEQIAALCSEWAHEISVEPVDVPDNTPETPTKTQAHQNIGSEDDQPELPIEESAEAEGTEEQAAAEPEPEPEPEPEQAPEPAEPQPVSLDALRDQVMRYAEEHGNTKAKALLAEFGKVSQVPEEDRNRIYVAAGGEL